MILSITFGILTFLSSLSNFLKKWKAIKIGGSVGLGETRVLFFRPNVCPRELQV